MTHIVRSTLNVCLLMLCGGCIFVPGPEYKSDGFPTRQNLSQEDAEKLQLDVTTREEVLLLFGEPDASFDDQSRFVYLWAQVTGWLVGVDVVEVPKGYLLEINFCPKGIVRHCEVRVAGLNHVFSLRTIGGVGYAPRREAAEKWPTWCWPASTHRTRRRA